MMPFTNVYVNGRFEDVRALWYTYSISAVSFLVQSPPTTHHTTLLRLQCLRTQPTTHLHDVCFFFFIFSSLTGNLPTFKAEDEEYDAFILSMTYLISTQTFCFCHRQHNRIVGSNENRESLIILRKEHSVSEFIFETKSQYSLLPRG
jgi:hypothetical protein